MDDLNLPRRGDRIERTTTNGAEPPLDPVGTTVAEFLVDLLDGIVVSLVYARADASGSPPVIDRTGAITSREGPGEWTTTLRVRLAGATGTVYGSPDPATGALPPELSELPEAAFRAADAIGRDAGVDGNDLIAPLRRALRDAVVIEMLVGELTRLSGGTLVEDDLCDFITAVLERFEEVTASVVEHQALSHGVVVRAAVAERHIGRRYPDDYRQKRVPLLFDGRNALLIIDAAGHVEGEVQGARPERRLGGSLTSAGTVPVPGEHGALVRLVSKKLGGIGFYAHEDRTIWVYSNGAVLLVKRGPRWRALPFAAIVRGVSTMAASSVAGSLAVYATSLLSMAGHGGIVAIVAPDADLDACLEDKDRLDRPSASSTDEGAVHAAIDHEDLDVATLLRVTAIDGATVIDTNGRLVAYGAVVRSDGSNAEGARTAAARSLSRFARVVLKVSEDGPVSVFKNGVEVTRILA